MLMARMVSHKMETEEDLDATRWLDRTLIRLAQVRTAVSSPFQACFVHMEFIQERGSAAAAGWAAAAAAQRPARAARVRCLTLRLPPARRSGLGTTGPMTPPASTCAPSCPSTPSSCSTSGGGRGACRPWPRPPRPRQRSARIQAPKHLANSQLVSLIHACMRYALVHASMHMGRAGVHYTQVTVRPGVWQQPRRDGLLPAGAVQGVGAGLHGGCASQPGN